MGKYIRKKIKEEKAAMSLLIFITVTSFVTILLGAYLTVTTLRKTQLESDIRLQEIYGKDVERVNEIYNELVLQDKNAPMCQITHNVLNNSYISYEFTFDKEVKNFTTEDINIYNASKIETSFGNAITLSISSPAYTADVTEGKTYIVMFDYEAVADEIFEIGLYSDTEENLPTKTLKATTEKKHEEYKFKANTLGEIFKISANIQDSNNINISNFEILEIENNQIQKGAFVKINDNKYTLVADYNIDSRYAIIINEATLTDLNENKNFEIIKGI